MSFPAPLVLIKLLHTLIWLFLNAVIFYLLYAAIVNKIDYRVWVCVGLVGLEILVLALNRMRCPLTNVAERYAPADKDNFDIYLPAWLARHNKTIYSIIFVIALLLLIWRMSGSPGFV